MKKIILAICLLVSVQSFSQGNIDTVNVASLTLKAGDWAYLVSYADGRDSTTLSFVRKLRTAAQALQNPTWNTDMTVTNIPGNIVLRMYGIMISEPYGMAASIGNNIYTKIMAINNATLSYHIGLIDASFPNQYKNKRNIGKNMLLDN